MISRAVAAQRIMQVAHEVIAVLLVERHVRSTHDDKLDFVTVVAQAFQLLNAVPGLDEGIVARSDGPHGCWLVSSVTLCRVLEVRIWASGTVDADVACSSDVRTSMGFGHHCNHHDT